MIDTLTTALVASSSFSSRWRVNSGTKVADSTPPRISSYTLFGELLADV
jgi:hypothetical protein